jgi:hypothetical protein
MSRLPWFRSAGQLVVYSHHHRGLRLYAATNHQDPFGSNPAGSVAVDKRAQNSETPEEKVGNGFVTRNSIVCEGRENTSPAFEAWLRDYRKRLEQAREERRDADR